MTLEYPLQEAYVSAGKPQVCVTAIADQLKATFSERDNELFLDTAVIETLSVDNARQLSDRGRQRASQQAHCIVRGFNTITQPAQNALLKILEEPAENTHFFLVTPAPQKLLETVRSRTTSVHLCPQDTSQASSSAQKFLATDSLPERLEIAEAVAEAGELRDFVATLAGTADADNQRLREALTLVSGWLDDASRSDQQIAEFISIASVSN